MSGDNTTMVAITQRQRRFADWTADVLIYIVVLNLFVEFVDAIVIESFWISILTAVLLVALLDVVVGFEHWVKEFFAQREGSIYTVLDIVARFLILFTSKLLILEVVNFVFGDQVELGHFLDVLLLIISMMAARAVIQKIYIGLGPKENPAS
jgi:hypothetical protein